MCTFHSISPSPCCMNGHRFYWLGDRFGSPNLSLDLWGSLTRFCVAIQSHSIWSDNSLLCVNMMKVFFFLSLSSGCLCSNFGLPATHICWLLIICTPFTHTLFNNSPLYFSLQKIVHSIVVIIAISPFTYLQCVFWGTKFCIFLTWKIWFWHMKKDLCEKNGPSSPDYWF